MPAVAVIPLAGAVAKQAAKVPVIGGAVKKIAGVVAKSDPETDAHRDATTREAYNKAIAGDVNAALYVRMRTGHWAAIAVPGYGNVGGWGSDHSKRIASELWQLILKHPSGIGERAKALYASISSGGAAPGSPQALAAAVAGHRLFGNPTWLVVLIALGLVVVAVKWWRR